MKSLWTAVLFFIFYICYLLFTLLLFGDNNLTIIKGQFKKSRSYVKADTLANKKVIDCAYLSFLMNDDVRSYILQADINGIHQGFNVFEGVARKLELAGWVSVWIKKSDLANPTPKIYKIFVDEEQVYENLNKPQNNGAIYLQITCLIGFFIAVYFLKKPYRFFIRKKKLYHT